MFKKTHFLCIQRTDQGNRCSNVGLESLNKEGGGNSPCWAIPPNEGAAWAATAPNVACCAIPPNEGAAWEATAPNVACCAVDPKVPAPPAAACPKVAPLPNVDVGAAPAPKVGVPPKAGEPPKAGGDPKEGADPKPPAAPTAGEAGVLGGPAPKPVAATELPLVAPNPPPPPPEEDPGKRTEPQ